ncbi:MAG: hypothetical protein JNM63_15580, partial [Spirochaetia bacterium]|nr:hypothetical protein [Spirochaetia bacterium]
KILIVEEIRTAKKFLDQLGIAFAEKTVYELNEHTKDRGNQDLAEKLYGSSGDAALFSEAGSPVIADPGFALVETLASFGVAIRYIPGASSIIGSLVVSGLPADDFYFAGFLPRKDHERKERLRELRRYPTTLVILEAPYRLNALLEALGKAFSPSVRVALCFSLTAPEEEIFRGTLGDAVAKFGNKNRKDPFVLLLENRGR